MDEARIEKIVNGYTVYINCKTHYLKDKEELIKFLERELK